MTANQLARIMLKLHYVTKIQCAGVDSDPETDIMGAYVPSGPNRGIYISGENLFYQIMRQYDPELSSREAQEAYWTLTVEAPSRPRTVDADLVPVNNGVFDFKTKQLMPFSPEYIFLTKSKVNYVRNPSNPVIRTPDGDDWDIESWMATLSDDPEIVNVLWEVCGAVIRPFVAG